MKRYAVALIILGLMVVGGLLRFTNITNNPNSLNIDEVAIGYNAFSILKTGRDEYGNFMPLSFRSSDDYKAPVSIYLMVPAIAVFGLNEFGVRFTNAFLSTLSIPLMFLLASEFLLGFEKTSIEFKHRKTISLIITTLFTISPWDIYFSRYAAEGLVAMVFLILGTLFLLKSLNGRIRHPIFAALFLVLSMYTYHSEKLFVPFFVLVFGLIFFKKITNSKKVISIFLITSVILGLPLVFSTLLGHDATRMQMTFIGNDVEFNRYVNVDSQNGAVKMLLLFFYWLRKYLFYFHPGFLFFSGLNMTLPNTQGLGVAYLFELPFFIFGSSRLLSEKFKFRLVIIAWILLGILPASLTQNEQHALRTLLILPAVVFISGYGSFFFLRWILKLKSRVRNSIFLFFGLIIIVNLLQAFLIFAVHFPTERGEDFMEGTKKTVIYALEHKNEYQRIVFDPYRGIDGPYIVSIPHMYILFYSQYDPHTYQTENHHVDGQNFSFDKFVVRRVNWAEDRGVKNTLFIASPWAIPEKDLKADELKRKVDLSNGFTAFIIASPK